jgi:hypothetical protein
MTYLDYFFFVAIFFVFVLLFIDLVADENKHIDDS